MQALPPILVLGKERVALAAFEPGYGDYGRWAPSAHAAPEMRRHALDRHVPAMQCEPPIEPVWIDLAVMPAVGAPGHDIGPMALEILQATELLVAHRREHSTNDLD